MYIAACNACHEANHWPNQRDPIGEPNLAQGPLGISWRCGVNGVNLRGTGNKLHLTSNTIAATTYWPLEIGRTRRRRRCDKPAHARARRRSLRAKMTVDVGLMRQLVVLQWSTKATIHQSVMIALLDAGYVGIRLVSPT